MLIIYFSSFYFQLPEVNKTNPNLNDNQALAVTLLIQEPEENWPSPVLVIGPFGCGKSFTLENAILYLLNLTGPRILICTRSNSAADLHVESLHKHVENEALRFILLRLYHKDRRIDSVSTMVKQYCLLSTERSNAPSHFRMPTMAELLQYRVIVTTFMSCHLLHAMKLPPDFFTHILLDEAAQALEIEVTLAVTLAGPKTKLALVGDYLQVRIITEHLFESV